MSTAKPIDEVLSQCTRGYVPVNLDIGLAIAAHQQSPSASTLQAVVLARMPTIEDMRRQLDYLTALPDAEWPDPLGGEEYRYAVLSMVRSNISQRA